MSTLITTMTGTTTTSTKLPTKDLTVITTNTIRYGMLIRTFQTSITPTHTKLCIFR